MMFNGTPPNFSTEHAASSCGTSYRDDPCTAASAAHPALRRDAGGWAARRDREEALAGSSAGTLPRPLALRVRVREERNGQLELAADAGAVAAIVRQRSAELLPP
jgi:hypothetical protein